MIHKKYLRGLEKPPKQQEMDSGRNWEKGHYSLSYPVDVDLAEICLMIDWKPGNVSETPSFQWMVNVPNSLFYLGQHFGGLNLVRGTIPSTGSEDITVINSRFRIY